LAADENRSGKNGFPVLALLKKTEEIEKLAKDIRSRAKG
jgi:hypothetical protein